MQTSLSQKSRAWAAGFFDGEGSISACILKTGTSSGTLKLQVRLSNNCHRAVLRFYRIVGCGSIRRSGKQTEWYAGFQVGAKALDVLYPYLVIKKSRADIYYRLAAEMYGLRGPRLTERIRRWRKKLVLRLQSLND